MLGERIAHFEITGKLGEGGMGQVFRARDTRLNRDVALKVLPEAFARDQERMARFTREAQMLAALNHPGIAAIYGVEHDGPRRALVMELVEGETLQDRISRGAVPPEECARIGMEIATALEAAHAKGIVHRDLKPANVMLTPGGGVKVLDFGLAKAAAAEPTGDPELSPTLTSAGTQAGIVLGTAAYMSPEQARGLPVDRRSDIWAFGVVLYEMLTGGRAFEGDSIADTMASVLKLEPDLGRLPPSTPAGMRRLLRRCLRKDPDRRLHDIADARIELDDMDPAVAGGDVKVPRPARALPLLAAAAAGLLAGAVLGWLLRDPGPAAPGMPAGASPVRRAAIPLPPGEVLSRGNPIALAPDGSRLALAIGLGESSRLHLRRLDSFDLEALSGTEGATHPFFSPDGSQLGFFSGGQLKKVSLRGGARDVTVLCDAPTTRSGTWDAGGWIYFTFGESRLARVRENGGEPEELGDAGEVHHVQALPGGRGTLITLSQPAAGSIRKDLSTLAVLAPDGRTVTPVLDNGYSARYLSSGHLVFMRSGGLFAVPFDLERLAASPPAVSVQPSVWTDSIWALARYDLAADGTLAYLPGGDIARSIPTWIDLETGKEEPLPVPAGVYNNFDLSPDGAQLAIQNASGAQDQVYIYDTRRGTFTRLTLEGASTYPVWSHDGREVFFASSRGGEGYRLYRQPVDGSALASPLLSDSQQAVMETHLAWPTSVTPDGAFLLLFTWAHPRRGGDLWKVPLDGAGDPQVVLASDANEIIPQISPDGRWLAFLTDRSGPYRIVVRPFPDVERREWVVSGDEGYDPRWSAQGDALLYRQGWGRLMRVPVGRGEDLAPGLARELFETDFHDAAGSSFAVSPDGKRVLVNKPTDTSLRATTPVALVTGWGTELSRLVPRN